MGRSLSLSSVLRHAFIWPSARRRICVSMIALLSLEKQYQCCRSCRFTATPLAPQGRSRRVSQSCKAWPTCYRYTRRSFISKSGRPSTLPIFPASLDSGDIDAPLCMDVGFRRIINVFSVVDTQLFDHGRVRLSSLPTFVVTAVQVESKQFQLDRDEAVNSIKKTRLQITNLDEETKLHRIDLFNTRVCIRALLWHQALSNGFIRNEVEAQTELFELELDLGAKRLQSSTRRIFSMRKSSHRSWSTSDSYLLIFSWAFASGEQQTDDTR